MMNQVNDTCYRYFLFLIAFSKASVIRIFLVDAFIGLVGSHDL